MLDSEKRMVRGRAKTSYHHGDLRAALIDQGLRLLAARDAEDLSLREVARGVGVSATAVYRHFPDKAALMAALAAEGLDMLSQVQHAAYDAAGGGVAGFSATGGAYVRFALLHTALFRLIFANPPSGEVVELANSPDNAMRFLMENAAKLAPPGMEPRIFALQSWSVAHGLAMLIIDGQLQVDDKTIDAVIDAHMVALSDERKPG
jgi:AcrR family transcriptional regulator